MKEYATAIGIYIIEVFLRSLDQLVYSGSNIYSTCDRGTGRKQQLWNNTFGFGKEIIKKITLYR
jgi:hypothetical protein